jgi:hypothetical protein
MLAPAEQVLTEDLFSFAEDHFPGLLPFTTLGRAGEHELRRQRRLVALLRAAAGSGDVTGEMHPWATATLMLDRALGTTSTQRVTLRYAPRRCSSPGPTRSPATTWRRWPARASGAASR